MQHNNYSPYVPNSMASDNPYLHLSPNPEEQSPQSYHQYHASKFPPSHVQSNDGQYYAGSGPGQVQNRELAWGSGMQQPFSTHNGVIPHNTHNIQPSSGYSTYPYATQFPPASLSFPMGGDSPHLKSAGPVDPNTGMIFYPSTESPRLRTVQACQKCRIRKAKVISYTISSRKLGQLVDWFLSQCSGEHPSCERCVMRGLVCEYAPEGRVRGPNRPKVQVDPEPMPGASRRARHDNVDPASGAGTSDQRRSEHNQFPYNSAEVVGGHFIDRHSEGSMSGFVALYYSPFLIYFNDSCNRRSPSARSNPITSPGITGPLYGAEMTIESQHHGNIRPWLTRPAFDRHYGQAEHYPSP